MASRGCGKEGCWSPASCFEHGLLPCADLPHDASCKILETVTKGVDNFLLIGVLLCSLVCEGGGHSMTD
jgi:hypothetical protein